MRFSFPAFFTALATFAALAAVDAKRFEPLDAVSLPNPSGVRASPNGQLAVYSELVYHADEDKITSSLYLLNLTSKAVFALTEPSFDAAQAEPFFLDDHHVAFFQQTADTPVGQLFAISVKPGDQKPYKLTNFPIGFGNVKYNAAKKLLAFTAMVYPDEPTLDGTMKRDQHLEETKRDSGLAFDRLLVRHYADFVPEKKSNIFVVGLALNDGRFKLAEEPRNLLAGTGLECPQFSLGDSSEYDISPDGEEVAFLSKIQDRSSAWQTSKHVYLVSTTGRTKPAAINADIPASTFAPKYSPSGLLAYLQMYTPKYEADRTRIVVYNRSSGKRTVIAKDWDRSPSELVFSADSTKVFVAANEYGRNKIFSVDLHTEAVETLTEKHTASGLSLINKHTLLFTVSSMRFPNIVHTLDISSHKLQRYEPSPSLAKALASIDMVEPEEFEFTGALDDQVHGWMVKPVDFDPAKKYPVMLLIHGGPEGAWLDDWSMFVSQLFSGAGYVSLAINPHGSTGYGQKFTEAILKNWGSHPYHDLEKGLDYALETYSFLDADRVSAGGASYGGYMINWLNGHTDRFRALVSHASTFSSAVAYYTTDVPSFIEIEFGGLPSDHSARTIYERFSPSNFVQNWKTPTLVTHGGRDYRVDDGEGFAAFTALQRLGVPSRFLYFPDESHIIVKPANALRWYNEWLDWINRWTLQPEEKHQQNSTTATAT